MRKPYGLNKSRGAALAAARGGLPHRGEWFKNLRSGGSVCFYSNGWWGVGGAGKGAVCSVAWDGQGVQNDKWGVSVPAL